MGIGGYGEIGRQRWPAIPFPWSTSFFIAPRGRPWPHPDWVSWWLPLSRSFSPVLVRRV